MRLAVTGNTDCGTLSYMYVEVANIYHVCTLVYKHTL